MKLPNGYGSVYKLPGRRRRPWIARKTVGWDIVNGKPKQLYYTIGYFKSRTEALEALADYNQKPIGTKRDITLKEIYEKWSETRYSKIGDKTRESYIVAWKHLSKIGDMKMRDIKKSHIQDIIDFMSDPPKDLGIKPLSYSSCHKVKVLAIQLFEYAMADDIVDKNYAELVELPEDTSAEREPFTEEEIAKIEELSKTDIWANTILILIYTGMRIGELLNLKRENVNIEHMLIIGGSKTEAGKNRIIPIHPKIQAYVKEWYDNGTEYLITRNREKIRINYYRKYLFYPTLEKAGTRKLTPHCTRHTFGTLLDKAGANTKAIQELIGHADYSTTANIYTHPDIQKLREEIEKMK